MQDLLNVVCLIVDGPEAAPSLDTSLAGAAVRMALMQRQNRTAPVMASRMQEIENVTSQMLGRYRKRVREEQLKLLQVSGLRYRVCLSSAVRAFCDPMIPLPHLPFILSLIHSFIY
jgi:hypothetical protein